MTINPRLKSTVSGSTTEPFKQKGSYRPSVPLSVYRELVKELQETQTRAETLERENQQLLEENQRLRNQLKQVIEIVEPTEERNSISRETELRKFSSSISDYGNNYDPLAFPHPKPYTVDVPPHPQREVSQSNSDGTMNGWVLAIAILLIVITSCTSAFLIVNSKLTPNNR